MDGTATTGENMNTISIKRGPRTGQWYAHVRVGDDTSMMAFETETEARKWAQDESDRMQEWSDMADLFETDA